MAIGEFTSPVFAVARRLKAELSAAAAAVPRSPKSMGAGDKPAVGAAATKPVGAIRAALAPQPAALPTATAASSAAVSAPSVAPVAKPSLASATRVGTGQAVAPAPARGWSPKAAIASVAAGTQPPAATRPRHDIGSQSPPAVIASAGAGPARVAAAALAGRPPAYAQPRTTYARAPAGDTQALQTPAAALPAAPHQPGHAQARPPAAAEERAAVGPRPDGGDVALARMVRYAAEDAAL